MADVVDPVFAKPGSRVITPSVVSSLLISTPETPSLAVTMRGVNVVPARSMTACVSVTWVMGSAFLARVPQTDRECPYNGQLDPGTPREREPAALASGRNCLRRLAMRGVLLTRFSPG